MPSIDRPDNNDIHTLLHDIRGQQDRQQKLLQECHDCITGGPRIADGLAYRTARLEHDAETDRESRTFWMRTIGTTAVGAFIASIGAILFKGGGAAHP